MNHVAVNRYAKTRLQSTSFLQSESYTLQVDKAAGLEAKSNEKGVPGKKPVGGKKGKKVFGITKQKTLVGRKSVATKTPAAKKPA